MRRYVVLLAALAALDNATGQTPAADSARPTALAGTVRDLLGHPVAGVTLTAEGRERSVQTDDSGRFHMAGIPAGPKLFTLAKLGFVAVSFQVRLAPDTTIVIDVHLRPVQSLSEVTVSSPGVSAKLT
ncbi:MAG TPA: carboxypeptidase regulatory-like domain-containing protein, partial [Gemmatimonadaceae bacterium]